MDAGVTRGTDLTRKDFVGLAAMLLAQKEPPPAVDAHGKERISQFAAHATWCRVVQATADLCEGQSKTFNRRRFLASCGLTAL